MRKRESGFTLIELLTVIAIIAILAAILLPVLGRARENGRRTSCSSNLHQLALAVNLYKQDNKVYPADQGEAPPAGFWYGTNDTSGDGAGLGSLFPEYIGQKKAFNCPDSDVSDPKDPLYNSYDQPDPAKAAPDNLKYRRAWKLAGTIADPSERRQLIWRNPPDSTIVTWCHLHRANPEATAIRAQDKDIIVTLEARAEVINATATSHAWNE